MSNFLDHARNEMYYAWADANGNYEEMQQWVVNDIEELMETFANQGHSGFSAHYVLNAFNTLAKFEPLTPLTGEEWEWRSLEDLGDEMRWQNIRDNRVFKKGDGTAYFIDGKIFRHPDGVCFTGSCSAVDITFPCIPESEYVNVDFDGNVLDS